MTVEFKECDIQLISFEQHNSGIKHDKMSQEKNYKLIFLNNIEKTSKIFGSEIYHYKKKEGPRL